jgi:alpha-glucosidase
MSYREPPPSFTSLHVAEKHNSVIKLHSKDAQGQQTLELRSYLPKAWAISLLYQDDLDSSSEFPELTPASIEIDDSASLQLSLSSESSKFRLQLESGFFEIIDSDGTVVFKSAQQPFFSHPQKSTLYEGLMSKKITDFSERAPFGPTGKTFESYMRRFHYPKPEGCILGLPGQSGEFNRQGYRFELYNTDTFLHLPDRRALYQSWPVVFHKAHEGDGWVCVFHHNPSRTFVDLGDFNKKEVSFESLCSNSEIFILFGDTLEEVSSHFASLFGTSPLLPLWSFGYQQCRWSYMSEKEVKGIVQRFLEEDIPLDSIYLDIDYMDGFRVFTHDEKNFPSIPALVDWVHEQDIKVIPIVDPGVKIDPNYGFYNQLMKKGDILETAEGKDFIAHVWPGECVLPDFFSESTKELWANKQADWMNTHQFDGVWNDMNEPSNFDGANEKTAQSRYSGGDFESVFNLYGKKMAETSALGCSLNDKTKRPFVITRSGYPGVQKSAVIWHGDNQAWWEHLQLALQTAVTYSLCGAYYTGPDVPGFTGNAPGDLAVRFFQLGAFLPFFRGHSIYFAEDKEPYSYDEPYRSAITSAIRLRYSLLREWYSSFEKSVRTRSAFLTPVFDSGELIKDQFLLFGKLLVAPVIERDRKRRSIYLPEGDWFRLGDSKSRISGGRYLLEEIDLGSVPVFVKAGTILTRNTVMKNTKETMLAEEHYEIYPDTSSRATGYWYSDDGISCIPGKKAQRIELSLQEDEVREKKVSC